DRADLASIDARWPYPLPLDGSHHCPCPFSLRRAGGRTRWCRSIGRCGGGCGSRLRAQLRILHLVQALLGQLRLALGLLALAADLGDLLLALLLGLGLVGLALFLGQFLLPVG